VDLQLSDEQMLLRDAVAELAAQAETSEALWSELTKFGAFDVGDGVGAVELALIARALGARLAAVPFAETAATAYVGAGAERTALCLAEPGRSFAHSEPEASFADELVTGEKTDVSFAATARRFAVSAEGPTLVLESAASPNIAIDPETTLDPSLEVARVCFDRVSAEAVDADVERLAAVAGLLVSAESVGAAASVLELARDYAATRRQFGHTIGSFQAIRHLLADMYVKVESSWSSVLYAAAALDEDEPDALRTASIAKAFTARATLEVAHGALQTFGGIAFTAEHPAHRFLRRIAVRGGQFGSAREHERSLGRQLAERARAVA
jgi:alkylation response protein AidB-like acyl-CoA dehydrogenase